jgi:uncharacterized protein (TIGR04255 family)
MGSNRAHADGSGMAQEETGGADREGLFPPSARVIFAKTPLIEVMAQVRFPPILKIEQTPADFQERIRNAFPLFEKVSGPILPPGAPPLPPEFLQFLGPQAGGITYRFRTEDSSTTVTLSTEALTLSTTSYTRWENFLEQFRAPLSALRDIYGPSFYIRIGLRYINGIQRDKIGFRADYPWSRLIRKDVLGETALPAFEVNLQEVTKKIRLTMTVPDGAMLFQHGISVMTGQTAPSYMLDFDIYRAERTEANDAERVLNEYHAVAGHAFRWCIEPELRDALGPIAVEGSHGNESPGRANP